MSLPAAWIDALFARLTVRYGAAFMRQYEGIPIESVKEDWGAVLGGFDAADIKHALQNLPADWPPAVMQFRALCNSRYRQEQEAPKLEGPLVIPGKVAELLKRIASAPAASVGPAAVAARLREIAKTRPLTLAQRAALAECENTDPIGGEIGQFTPIPNECLPPGMRA
jgi:hypothetical protein